MCVRKRWPAAHTTDPGGDAFRSPERSPTWSRRSIACGAFSRRGRTLAMTTFNRRGEVNMVRRWRIPRLLFAAYAVSALVALGAAACNDEVSQATAQPNEPSPTPTRPGDHKQKHPT